MALLGVHGTVSLSREWAQPVAVDSSRLLLESQGALLDLGEPAFWSGDRVLLLCQRGVPLALLEGTQEGYAPCPGGYSFYGDGDFVPGPTSTVRAETGTTYVGTGTASFYDDTPLTNSAYAFIHRNEMDDISFYSSQNDALNGSGSSLIPLLKLDVGALLVLPAPEGDYEQALIDEILPFIAPSIFLGRESEVVGDQFLPQDTTSKILAFLEESSVVSGWKQVANLTSWVLETNVDVLDQNAIGQKFGESAKGALKGAGSFNAIIDAKQNYQLFGPSSLLRLMLLTDVGAKANAKFVIADSNSSQSDCEQNKKIYYETPIIISNSTVDTSVAEIITMTIQFVATGRIRLALASEG